MALPIYALTLFVSAFILFLVQPIVGKIILPKLGGTPQVWNTCMVFFQMMLLAGYGYTHNASTRLNLRQQLIAHAVLLLLPLIVLLPFPFAFGGEFNAAGEPNPHSLWGFLPDLGSNPIPSTLLILVTYVALPFVVVATSAPLLQKWFVHTGHPAARDPYFLYGASNFGSMLSLILYPIAIEPFLPLRGQGWMYVIGYMTLVVMVVICAVMVWNSKESKASAASPKAEPKPEPAPSAPAVTAPEASTGITATPAAHSPATALKSGPPPKTGKTADHAPTIAAGADDMTNGRRFRWIMLAAIPSSLMLGITTHVTTDLSPNPVFWLVPLILYLLSFILVFARWPVVWTEQPHNWFLYAQPFFLGIMILADVFNLATNPSMIGMAVFAHVAGFFATTMMCHGELAKDRPTTRYLTEFYLWMSVGGMLGGVFNGLVAPYVFNKYWEFPITLFAAAIIRPRMFPTGVLDNFLAGMFESPGGGGEAAPKPGHKGPKAHHAPAIGVTASESLVRTLDFAWPALVLVLTLIFSLVLSNEMSYMTRNFILYGVPLIVCGICFTRPIRFGLGVGAILALHAVFTIQAESNTRGMVTLQSSRSYFGAISVQEIDHNYRGVGMKYRRLIHGVTDHGMNFLIPAKEDRGKPDKDASRLATTYYHREGPVGRVMEKFNWHSNGASNTFHADARLPAALVGDMMAAAGTGFSHIPAALTECWSEPPIATVGLGTGTMASYGRPYQFVYFYEIDNQILKLSLATESRNIKYHWEDADLKPAEGVSPVYQQYLKRYRKPLEDRYPKKVPFFSYLEQAIERGCNVQVLMGDARLRMAMEYKNHYTDETDRGGGPDGFFHMMVVDAFSSDAIPAHLLTEQGFKMYFSKLSEDGILCVHTSNKFVALPKVVAAVASKQKRGYLVGHDNLMKREEGHYTSEWVMVARKHEYLKHLSDDDEFLKRYREEVRTLKNYKETSARRQARMLRYWGPITVHERYAWTDDYYNLLSVMRYFHDDDDD